MKNAFLYCERNYKFKLYLVRKETSQFGLFNKQKRKYVFAIVWDSLLQH